MTVFPFTSKSSSKKTDKMSATPKPFTQIQPIDASTIPRPGNPDYKKHLDELVAAATEVIEGSDKWKSKGKYHHVVEVRERTDWRGKYNWVMRRSMHKGIPFDVFKVKLPTFRQFELMIARVIPKPFSQRKGIH